MRDPEKFMNAESEIANEKRVYTAPVLTAFGLIRDLTATGSGATTENKGADEKNNMLMMP